jgi:hypothetical protein
VACPLEGLVRLPVQNAESSTLPLNADSILATEIGRQDDQSCSDRLYRIE